MTVPDGADDTATFDASSITSIVTVNDIEVNGIVFNADASAYTITPAPSISTPLTLSGAGITNNSSVTQSFISTTDLFRDVGAIYFTNSASAGTNTSFTCNGGLQRQALGAFIEFMDTSTAAGATLTANGATTSGAFGGQVIFQDSADAGSAVLVANGGVSKNSYGAICFMDDSLGDMAEVTLSGNAVLDIGRHDAPGVGIRGLNGSGTVFLGANNLTIGTSESSFSGVIRDGGPGGGRGGSITIEGYVDLTLSGANTYSGGTIVHQGSLIVANTTGSATGRGMVQIAPNDGDTGSFYGQGTVTGPVVIGNSISEGGADLNVVSGVLSIQQQLIFNGSGGLLYVGEEATDSVSANGVTINGGAVLIFGPFFDAPKGTVITVLNNTSSSPINGVFSNFPDKSVYTLNHHRYLVNYEGGDGNDLTFTVTLVTH